MYTQFWTQHVISTRTQIDMFNVYFFPCSAQSQKCLSTLFVPFHLNKHTPKISSTNIGRNFKIISKSVLQKQLLECPV